MEPSCSGNSAGRIAAGASPLVHGGDDCRLAFSSHQKTDILGIVDRRIGQGYPLAVQLLHIVGQAKPVGLIESSRPREKRSRVPIVAKPEQDQVELGQSTLRQPQRPSYCALVLPGAPLRVLGRIRAADDSSLAD